MYIKLVLFTIVLYLTFVVGLVEISLNGTLNKNSIKLENPNIYEETLRITNSKITEIDPNFLENLPNVTYFHIYDSDLLELTYNLTRKFQQFESIHLKQVKAKIQDDAFQNLKKLKFLIMLNVTIDKFPKDFFKGTPELQEFYAEGYIKKVEAEVFKSTQKLEYISLSQNQLTQIEEGTFNTLKKLLHLNLSNNSISVLSGKEIPVLSSLGYLVLDHNPLTTFKYEEIKQNLPKVKLVSVSGCLSCSEAKELSSKYKEIRVDENEIKLC